MKIQVNKNILIEEMKNYLTPKEIIMDLKEIFNYLPKKYHKLLKFQLEKNKAISNFLNDFYKYRSFNVPNIFNYIPLGYDNGDYIVYDIENKKLGAIYHDVFYNKKIHPVPKDSWSFLYALGLSFQIKLPPKLNEVEIKKLESKISKELGFKIKFDNDDISDYLKSKNNNINIIIQENNPDKIIHNIFLPKSKKYLVF